MPQNLLDEMLPEGDGGCGQPQEGGDAQPDALAQAVGHIIGGEPEEQPVPVDTSCSQQVADAHLPSSLLFYSSCLVLSLRRAPFLGSTTFTEE